MPSWRPRPRAADRAWAAVRTLAGVGCRDPPRGG